jgi:D-erythro-7,8-dihydroneopterin triphosphate epimerase
MTATIHIVDLKLKTIIGVNGWERKQTQTVIINVTIRYNATKAIKSDKISDTLNYRTLKKSIIHLVTTTRYHLLEKLAHQILELVLEKPLVREATIRIDKPGALRFAKSVAVEMSSRKSRERS